MHTEIAKRVLPFGAQLHEFEYPKMLAEDKQLRRTAVNKINLQKRVRGSYRKDHNIMDWSDDYRRHHHTGYYIKNETSHATTFTKL